MKDRYTNTICCSRAIVLHGEKCALRNVQQQSQLEHWHGGDDNDDVDDGNHHRHDRSRSSHSAHLQDLKLRPSRLLVVGIVVARAAAAALARSV